MKTMLEHLSKLTGRTKPVKATTEKGLAHPLVRKGLPAFVIGSAAVIGLRRRRARRG